MNAAEKIAHAAERKAFEAMLDSLIRKSQTKDVCTHPNHKHNNHQNNHTTHTTPHTNHHHHHNPNHTTLSYHENFSMLQMI